MLLTGAAVAEEDWPADPDWLAEVREVWEAPWGDRRQELVLIGIDMDEPALRAQLNACLLDDAELAAAMEDGLRNGAGESVIEHLANECRAELTGLNEALRRLPVPSPVNS